MPSFTLSKNKSIVTRKNTFLKKKQIELTCMHESKIKEQNFSSMLQWYNLTCQINGGEGEVFLIVLTKGRKINRFVLADDLRRRRVNI